MVANRWESLLASWEPKLRKAFMESIARIRNVAQLSEIETALRRGDVGGALDAVGLDPASFRAFDKTFEAAFEAGGIYTAQRMPLVRADGRRAVFQFAIRNPQAEQWLRAHSSSMVRDIIDDQRTLIRNALERGLRDGDNPRTTALDLVGRINRQTGNREGGLIGLTSSQAQWVENYRAELEGSPAERAAALQRGLRDARFDGTVRRSIANDEPLAADDVDSMVTAYRNRALRFRAETIARTETIRALHEAQDQAVDQAVGGGAVAQSTVTFIWRTAGDARVRDSHQAMDGQEVAFGESFVSGDGNMLAYPCDPSAPISETANCRCWREVNVDFLAGIK